MFTLHIMGEALLISVLHFQSTSLDCELTLYNVHIMMVRTHHSFSTFMFYFRSIYKNLTMSGILPRRAFTWVRRFASLFHHIFYISYSLQILNNNRKQKTILSNTLATSLEMLFPPHLLFPSLSLI